MKSILSSGVDITKVPQMFSMKKIQIWFLNHKLNNWPITPFVLTSILVVDGKE